MLIGSRRVDEVHEALKAGCWGARSTRTGPTTALYGRGTIDDDENNESLETSKDFDDEETITSDTSSSDRDVPNKVVKAPSVSRVGGDRVVRFRRGQTVVQVAASAVSFL